MAKPIAVFKSQEQFLTYAKDWQHKLFLDDWLIEFKLTENQIKMKDAEADTESLLWGYNSFTFENSSSIITVYNGKILETGIEGPDFSKNIAELTLVHELLHLKSEYISEDYVVGELPPIQQAMLHRSIEMMAKTLLMAKYNLSFDYFKNNLLVSDKTCKVAIR